MSSGFYGVNHPLPHSSELEDGGRGFGELWQDSSPLVLHGDYYRSNDDVTRGVTMPPPEEQGNAFRGASMKQLSECDGVLPEGSMRSSALITDGDYYGAAESGRNVLRGITLGSGDILGGPAQYPGPFDSEFLDDRKLCGGSSAWSALQHVQQQEAKHGTIKKDVMSRFPDTCFPPDVPDDSLFEFELTTLRVMSTQPYEIGNHLLDLLHNQLVSSVSKVNINKFSIKTELFKDNLSCNCKIRVYRDKYPTYVIEFQRRGGDSLAFNNCFKEAVKFLKRRLTPIGCTRAPADGTPLPIGRKDFPDDDNALIESYASHGVLLELAASLEAPQLQAEAAVSLASLLAAADDTEVEAFCSSQDAVDSIVSLLKVDAPEVSVPTGNMLLTLARRVRRNHQAAALYLKLRDCISLRVQSDQVCTATRSLLSEVLEVAESSEVASSFLPLS